jgi:hypothetical protein
VSLEAFKWAKTVRDIPPMEKWLLVMIADHYSDTKGMAWPGKNLLSEETGISLRNITRLLSSLHSRGLIRIQHWINNSTGQNLNNRYFLPIFDPASSAADDREFVIVDPGYDHIEGKVIFIDDFMEKSA